ncbi:MAG: hypothetical protein AAF667_09565 [Pseudomonadota bacterium]
MALLLISTSIGLLSALYGALVLDLGVIAFFAVYSATGAASLLLLAVSQAFACPVATRAAARLATSARRHSDLARSLR